MLDENGSEFSVGERATLLQRTHGIEIVERVPIPDWLIPSDAQVEMDAKKAAGYFSATKPGSNELARPKGRGLME